MVSLVIFIYDARTHIHQTMHILVWVHKTDTDLSKSRHDGTSWGKVVQNRTTIIRPCAYVLVFNDVFKSKDKIVPVHAVKALWGVEVYL